MNIAVGAQSVGCVELAILGAVESEGLLAVVEANNVREAEVGSGTSFDPAFCIRLALRGVRRIRAHVLSVRGAGA